MEIELKNIILQYFQKCPFVNFEKKINILKKYFYLI